MGIISGAAAYVMRPLAMSCGVLLASLGGAHADAAHILDLLQTDRLFVLLQKESVAYGEDMAEDMLGARQDAAWTAILREMNDPKTLLPEYRATFEATLDPAQISAIEAWLSSGLGKRTVDLELAAREAMLDPVAEDKAIAAAARADKARSPALAAVRRVIAAGDMIDASVASAMNANLAFYRAMSEGGAFPQKLTEEVMIGDVASEEDSFRQDITAWTEGWLLFAYRPFGAKDMKAIAAFEGSAAGRALDKAQTAAFDEIYNKTSADLGTALARRVGASDL